MQAVTEQAHRNPTAQGDDAAGDSAGAARAPLEEMRAELMGALTSIQRLLHVRRGLLELTLFDRAFHLASVVAGASVATAMLVTAAVLAVGSVRRALSAWSGGAWWGDLVVALCILLATAAGAWSYRRWMHGSILAATNRRLSGARPKPTEAGQES